mmetsp:Transcript_26125/g.60918  ORF Transcript_26125/g.60918 Transcript_26125/m.60918 type:complete len:469 (-) Transcript_26125:108-1514(-)
MGGLLPKPETAKEVEDGTSACGSVAYGLSSMQGWRRSMEDAHLAMPDFDADKNIGVFAVFDGHGGSAVAKVVASHAPNLLKSLPAYQEGRYEDALQELYFKLDEFLVSPAGRKALAAVTGDCPMKVASAAADQDEEDDEIPQILRGMMAENESEEEEEELDAEDDELEVDEPGFDDNDDEEEDDEPPSNLLWSNSSGPEGMGTTAVLALIRRGENPELFVANAGDSRCLVGSNARAIDMSVDHKPTMLSERDRIQKAGGFVSAQGRVDGNLNLSRSLGDFAYKQDSNLKPEEQKITCAPEIFHRRLTAHDRYVILGCDGIFEKKSNQQLLDFLMPKLRQRDAAETSDSSAPLSELCSDFLDANIARVPMKEQGEGCDNMTLMLVDLQAVPKLRTNTKRCVEGTSIRGRFRKRSLAQQRLKKDAKGSNGSRSRSSTRMTRRPVVGRRRRRVPTRGHRPCTADQATAPAE